MVESFSQGETEQILEVSGTRELSKERKGRGIRCRESKGERREIGSKLGGLNLKDVPEAWDKGSPQDVYGDD